MQPGELAKAVAQAKALGVSLEQVEQISSSLLNFEQSISSELEAELLTGKNLNLEKARLAALNGDIATVAEEIAKQTGSAADFTEMNVIQQEALAKSVGMTREDLAKSLMEREALVKLSGKEGKTAQERFNNLVKEVGLEEAKKRLGDDNLANLYAGQNVQERFTAAIEKLKEIFVSLAEPLMPVIDAFAEIFKIVGPIAGVVGQMVKYIVIAAKYLTPLILGFKTLQFVTGSVAAYNKAIAKQQARQRLIQKGLISDSVTLGGVKKASLLTTIKQNIQERLGLGIKKTETTLEKGSLWKRIGSAVMSAFKAFAGLGPLGWALAGVSAAAVTALGYKFLAGNDVMSKGGYGKRTLMAPEGAIALNDKDTVIAGTNLFPDDGKPVNDKPMTSSPVINMQPVIDRLAAVENVLVQILNKDTNVYMDSTKVGTALNVGTVRIQ
jgi:hypothetical protein